MPKVVVINGYSGAGKDTFVALCAELYRGRIRNIHASDKAKAALELLGWDGERTPEARDLLAAMVEFSYKFNGPFKYAEAVAAFMRTEDILFIHSREYENVQQYAKMFDGIKVYVSRAEAESAAFKAGNYPDRNAGRGLSNYHYIINNNGSLEDLRRMAEKFLTVVLGVKL